MNILKICLVASNIIFLLLACRVDEPFERVLPPDGSGPNSVYYSIRRIEDSLKLDSIQNGFNGLTIRIWFNCSQTSKGQLITVSQKNDKYEALFFNYYTITDDLKLYKYIIAKQKVIPKSGWKKFIKFIEKSDIMKLPDVHQLKGYLLATTTDPCTATFETSNREMYRLYQYYDPSSVSSKYSEAEKAAKIINYVQNEFSLNLLSSF
jgi:hypothetical protein